MHIAVLFGGNSSERAVSIASASQVVAALRTNGHSVTAIDTAKGVLLEDDEEIVFQSEIQATPPSREELANLHDKQTWVRLIDTLFGFDIVFIAMHGAPAEDGRLQSLFELSGIRHTGSRSLGSSLAWHKDIAKQLFVQNDIPTPPWVNKAEGIDGVKKLGFPVVVKPSGEGSTVGLTLVHSESELDAAIQKAGGWDNALIERFIKGRELTVGVLEGTALGVGEIGIDPTTTFSYDLKYQKGAVVESFPAQLPDDTYKQAQDYALAAHQALGLRGYSRADFRLDDDNNLWLMEVNSLPGMTATSLLPQSAAVAGISFKELCERICGGSDAIN